MQSQHQTYAGGLCSLMSLSAPPTPLFYRNQKTTQNCIKLKDPQNSYHFLFFGPSSNIVFPPKMVTTSFSWKCYKNRGISRFENMKFWGPKRLNYFLPVLRPQKMMVFFWPLASLFFSPFDPLTKGWQIKTLFFATPSLII